jgi:hypothetical protein
MRGRVYSSATVARTRRDTPEGFMTFRWRNFGEKAVFMDVDGVRSAKISSASSTRRLLPATL